MMEPDFEAAKLRVYEEFGIWKPGEKCIAVKTRLAWVESYGGGGFYADAEKGFPWHRCDHRGFYQMKDNFGLYAEPHDIPPPELTDAIAWKVLIAARIFSDEIVDQVRLQVRFALDDWYAKKTGESDPKRALILALDKALAGAGQGAHEA